MKPETVKLIEAEVTAEVPAEATAIRAKVVDDKSSISFGARSGPTAASDEEKEKIKKLEKKIETKMKEISALRGEIKKARKRLALYEKALSIQ